MTSVSNPKRRKRTASVAAFALSLAFAACSPEPKASDASPPKAELTAESLAALQLGNPDLEAGRATWLKTCATCHLTGLTGAPKIGDKAAWAPRIAKGIDTLYDHALHGFIGPDYTEMPPKGGFADLTDDQVKQAVRFVTYISK